MAARERRGSRWLPHRLVLASLGAFLLLLPLPFGSVQPWTHTVIQVTGFLLLAFAAIAEPHLSNAWPALLPSVCIAGVALVGVFQGSEVPRAIIGILAPEHARVQADAAEVLRASGQPEPVPATLSLNPMASRAAALTWFAAAACMLAAAAACAGRKDRRVLAFALVVSGLFQVLVGATNLTLAPTAIWGIRVPNDPLRLRGTFINADHLALYLELVLPVVFAWGWWAVRRTKDDPRVDRQIAMVAPPAIVWLTLFVGLTFTGSRAGLVAAGTGATVQGLLLALRRHRWRLGVVGILAAFVGIGTAAFIGLQQGLGRWLGTSQYELTWGDRLDVYRHAFELWERFPLTGTGLSTFRDAFTLVAPRELSSTWYWHAHNDFLEILVTTGLVGATLAAVAIVTVAVRLAPVFRDGVHSEDRAAALAAFGALAAVAVHSFFDFGLSMPANSVTLAIMLGAAIVAPRAQGQTEMTAQ